MRVELHQCGANLSEDRNTENPIGRSYVDLGGILKVEMDIPPTWDKQVSNYLREGRVKVISFFTRSLFGGAWDSSHKPGCSRIFLVEII